MPLRKRPCSASYAALHGCNWRFSPRTRPSNYGETAHYWAISSNIARGLPSPLALSREALTPVGLLRHPSRPSRLRVR
ncbi:protein of unknown function [Methanoculleus bourgensis]|uniref:Uncharacterized protein n=1 Tax=Methanoculleus bourgensis TaxID=83986 RepID=A0A0X3BIA0_9EURY|nr:protein of unknown function [Methanoculleus bourgensis]